jgi:hypothetical protein
MDKIFADEQGYSLHLLMPPVGHTGYVALIP